MSSYSLPATLSCNGIQPGLLASGLSGVGFGGISHLVDAYGASCRLEDEVTVLMMV
jgi:hypothetical protein